VREKERKKKEEEETTTVKYNVLQSGTGGV